jgi:hypothetical protein
MVLDLEGFFQKSSNQFFGSHASDDSDELSIVNKPLSGVQEENGHFIFSEPISAGAGHPG